MLANRIGIVAGAFLCLFCAAVGGCSDATGDVRPTSSSGSDFWETFEIDAEWVEYYPTLREMADKADVVLLGHVASVRHSSRQQGDATDDITDEIVVKVEVSEMIAGSVDSTSIDVTLIYPHRDFDEALLERLSRNVPAGDLLLMARRRQSGMYRPVNGYGLWTETPRGPVDAPLNTFRPADGIYASEVAGLTSVEDLADRLK